jgi:Tfp pilus assembly protein PilN
MLLSAVVIDYYVASSRLDEVNTELANEKRIAAELEANRAQKIALENQIKTVQERIKIIEDLEKNQKGPSAMLDLINSTVLAHSTVQLDTVAQANDTVTITGVADETNPISAFSKELELGSNGLFQNFNLETSQTEVEEEEPNPEDPSTTIKKKYLKYKFTIKGNYLPANIGKPAGDAAAAATTPSAKS